MISRRSFLFSAVAASMLSNSSYANSASSVPSALDHILLGCNKLEEGIALVEIATGVRARFGGVHPGRGTCNALISFGNLHYLEIIAPDPGQDIVSEMTTMLKELDAPKLIGWAAHTNDIESLDRKVRAAKLRTEGIQAGSRRTEDGRLLQWKTLDVADPDGLLPFFIQWSPDSPHPSTDAPHGLQLESFFLATPNIKSLTSTLNLLGLDVQVQQAKAPRLQAQFTHSSDHRSQELVISS
jgi:hypothetical protein